jgi:hypothetical protein
MNSSLRAVQRSIVMMSDGAFSWPPEAEAEEEEEV